MIEHLLKLKLKTVIQKLVLIGVDGSPGDPVLSHVIRTVSQNRFKIDIDVGQLMALRIVALVPDTNIMIMLRDLVIQIINVPQFVNGVIGVSGVLAIPTVSRE